MVYLLAILGSAVFGFLFASDSDELGTSLAIGALGGMFAAFILNVTHAFDLDFESGGALLCFGIAASSLCYMLPDTSWSEALVQNANLNQRAVH